MNYAWVVRPVCMWISTTLAAEHAVSQDDHGWVGRLGCPRRASRA